MLKRNCLFRIVLVLFISGTVISLSGCLGGEERIQNPAIPNIITGVDSYSPPAYRGYSTLVNLVMNGINVTKGTEISLSYKTQLWHTDGSWEGNPESVHLTPEQKPLVFQRTVKIGESPEKLYYNLTVDVDKNAAEGEYYITISGKDKSLAFENAVLSFKIGKGGKLPLPKKNVWNIGYTTHSSLSEKERAIGSSSLVASIDEPPLSAEEKAEAIAIAVNHTSLKGKSYRVTGVSLGFYDSGNFSGFFPVVTVNIDEPGKPSVGVWYVIDLEEKRVSGSARIFRRPTSIKYFFLGQAFDEAAGILTKKWDAGNFAGFWRDAETGTSTETLVINQSILNSSYRRIEKHNLIYTTKSIPLKYQVYAQANKTPPGTEGFYPAIGWQGEKYVFLPGNRIARIILEQNASEEKFMRPGETWNLGEGYSIFVNSVEIKAGVPQTWFILIKDGEKISDVILGPYIERSYVYQTEQDTAPVVIVYFSGFKLDGEAFKYGWLRSQNTIGVEKGSIFGFMEITSTDNGTIELRNREPIDLAPGRVVNLMGDIGIQVESSETGLLFYPVKG